MPCSQTWYVSRSKKWTHYLTIQPWTEHSNHWTTRLQCAGRKRVISPDRCHSLVLDLDSSFCLVGLWLHLFHCKQTQVYSSNPNRGKLRYVHIHQSIVLVVYLLNKLIVLKEKINHSKYNRYCFNRKLVLPHEMLNLCRRSTRIFVVLSLSCWFFNSSWLPAYVSFL